MILDERSLHYIRGRKFAAKFVDGFVVNDLNKMFFLPGSFVYHSSYTCARATKIVCGHIENKFDLKHC